MPERSNIKVIIVDDDPTISVSLECFLDDLDYMTLTASSGDEALDILNRDRADLAIVDMHMPGIDSVSMMIKAHEQLPNLRFLVHTGSPDYQIPPQLTSIGITSADILLKPVSDLNIIDDAILRLLS